MFGIVIVVFVVILLVTKSIVNNQRRELLSEILSELHLEKIDSQLEEYDDSIIVKSRQTLNNYSDLKYFKDNDVLVDCKMKLDT